MWESIVDSNARFRYSYTGSGWSVRSIDPEKAEPKRDARRTPRLAVVFGAFALVCVVAGSVIFARRAPQLEQPPSVATANRPDFIVSSPVIPANKVGSIPGLAAPAPATPETKIRRGLPPAAGTDRGRRASELRGHIDGRRCLPSPAGQGHSAGGPAPS